jgi:solute:Na+ symporter, SSS family
MKAVIWTDVAQFLLYSLGSLITLGLLLHRIPGRWNEVMQVAATHGDKLQIFDFTLSLTTKYTFWAGVIGGTFLTMASHGTDQTIVQRLLAARNQRESGRALVASGVIVLLQFAVFLFIGVLLFVFSQHSPLLAAGERADRILPLFLVREVPPGLAGLLLASILAVAMSNASGALNSLAASSVVDFTSLSGKSADPTRILTLSKRMTLVWGAILIVFGLMRWGPLLETGLTVASLPFGSLLGLFLLGTFDSRANGRGVITGMVAGLLTVLAIFRYTSVAFTWYVLVGSCTTLAVGAVVSRLFPVRERGPSEAPIR